MRRAARDGGERSNAGAERGEGTHRTSLAQRFHVIVWAVKTTKRTWLDALKKAAGEVR
jgi:hypothetical protein